MLIIDSCSTDTTLEITVILNRPQLEMRFLLPRHAVYEIIQDVKIPLAVDGRLRDTRSLEVVFDRLESIQPASIIELKLGIVSKAGRIVVGQGMGASECFEDKLKIQLHSSLTTLSGTKPT